MSFSMDIIRKSKTRSLPSSKTESVQYKDSYDKFEDVLETVLQENRVFNITMIQEGIFIHIDNDSVDVEINKIVYQVLDWFNLKITEKYESFCRMIDMFSLGFKIKNKDLDPSIKVNVPDYIRYSYGERYNSSSYLSHIMVDLNRNMEKLKKSGSLSNYSSILISLMKDNTEDVTLDRLRACLAGDPISTISPYDFQGRLEKSFKTEYYVSKEVSLRAILDMYTAMVATIKPAINRIKNKLLDDASSAKGVMDGGNIKDYIPGDIPDDTKWLTKSYVASRCNDLKEACTIYYIYFATLCDTAEEEFRMYWRTLADNKEVL